MSEKNDVEIQIEMMEEHAKTDFAALSMHADGLDIDHSEVTDEQFLLWWMMKNGKIPPPPDSGIKPYRQSLWILPDGQPMPGSVWEVALAVAANQPEFPEMAKLARDLIARYERALLKVAQGRVA